MTIGDVTFSDLSIGDAGWLIQRHGELYAADEGFDANIRTTGRRNPCRFHAQPGSKDRTRLDRAPGP